MFMQQQQWWWQYGTRTSDAFLRYCTAVDEPGNSLQLYPTQRLSLYEVETAKTACRLSPDSLNVGSLGVSLLTLNQQAKTLSQVLRYPGF
jgi:hypothetical protein